MNGNFTPHEVDEAIGKIQKAITETAVSDLLLVREDLSAELSIQAPTDTPIRNRMQRIQGNGSAHSWYVLTPTTGTEGRFLGTRPTNGFFASGGVPTATQGTYIHRSVPYTSLGDMAEVSFFSQMAGKFGLAGDYGDIVEESSKLRGYLIETILSQALLCVEKVQRLDTGYLVLGGIKMPSGVYKRTKPNYKKGKTYEKVWGSKGARELKEKLRFAHLGQVAWNIGLTAKDNDSVKRIAISKMGVPRPDMYGNKFSIGPSVNKQKAAIKRNLHFPSAYTSIERQLWKILQELDIEFRKQKVLISKFRVDVYVKKYSLVIEADGEYWHTRKGDKEKDQERDDLLYQNGYVVLRFWGDNLMKKSESCKRLIKKVILKLDKGKVRTARRLAEIGRDDLSLALKK